MKISFSIPGQPVAKARHRTAILKQCRKCHAKTVRAQCKCGSFEFNFLAPLETTPKETRMYENLVAMAAAEAMRIANQQSPISGPIRMTVRMYFAIPKSRQKKLRDGDPHPQKPDRSNALKAIEDGCNKIVYYDDAQCYAGPVEKYWSNQPRAEVEIETN